MCEEARLKFFLASGDDSGVKTWPDNIMSLWWKFFNWWVLQ